MDGTEFLWCYPLNKNDMKKIIFLTALMMAMLPSVANAQLNIASRSGKTVTICQSRTMMGNAELRKSCEGIYYIYISSSNQFDFVELFFIGDSRESALQTLRDLERLFETTKKGESVYITDHAKTKIHLYKINKKQFSISFEIQAGIRCLSLRNVQAFIDALSFYN